MVANPYMVLTMTQHSGALPPCNSIGGWQYYTMGATCIGCQPTKLVKTGHPQLLRIMGSLLEPLSFLGHFLLNP